MSCSYFKTLATSVSDRVRVIEQWLLLLRAAPERLQ
jgi:hypothetical protein